MTHHLVLDDEQKENLEAITACLHAMMDARARRLDPDDVVTKAARMARNKAMSIMAQFDLGPLRMWEEMPIVQQDKILQLARAMLDAETFEVRAILYGGMREIMLQRLPMSKLPWGDDDEPQADPQVLGMEEAAEMAASKPPKMRKVRRKDL